MRALSVTVIIPTYKPDKKLRELVRRLDAQTVQPDRILLINTEEEYFRPEAVKGVPEAEVIHIQKKDFDHGGTRDMGARMADTDLLLFMTQDALPADKKLIENLTRGFDAEDVAAVYARQLPRKDSSLLEKRSRRFNYGPDSLRKTEADLKTMGIKAFFCSNVCAAYRRDIYLSLGGFERRTIFNEDMIFARKILDAGYAIVYRSDARVFHSHSYTGMQQLRRNFDLGVSQTQHPDVFGDVSSESEGVKLVLSETKDLIRSAHLNLVPKLIMDSGMKYIGYRLGKNYQKLPAGLIRQLTMNPGYWESKEEEKDGDR